jgi:hypothetical protein
MQLGGEGGNTVVEHPHGPQPGSGGVLSVEPGPRVDVQDPPTMSCDELCPVSLARAVTFPGGGCALPQRCLLHCVRLQGVVVQPVGNRGVLIAGIDTVRGFGRLDQVGPHGECCLADSGGLQ